jgi:flagellar export protein FliJ
MKSLDALVRLHKWRIDEGTRKLAELELLATQMQGQIEHIDERLAAESQLAGESIEAATSYSSFMRVEIGRRRTLELSLVDLGAEIAEAREALAVAFRELKTYEITLERKREQAALQRSRRQQSALDEIGLIQHRARSGERLA